MIEPPQDGTTTGLILVGSPKVFARERLVRDREEQKKWLKTQLSVADEAFDAFQGAVQTRQLQRRSTSVGVDATAAGALAIQQSEASGDDLRRAQEVADLEHRIRIAELEAQLDAAEDGDLTAATASTGTGAGSGEGSGGDSGGSSGGNSGGASGGSGTSGGSSGSGGGSSPTLPGTAIDAVSVKDRPIDRFRDRLAYRDEVRQELLDNDLDDAHDLAGNALYRLAFDTTILPAGDTSRWGLVHMSIDPEKQFQCPKDDKGWESVSTNTISQLVLLSEGFVAEMLRSLAFEVDLLARAYVTDDLSTVRRETAALVYRTDSDPQRNFLWQAQFLDELDQLAALSSSGGGGAARKDVIETRRSELQKALEARQKVVDRKRQDLASARAASRGIEKAERALRAVERNLEVTAQQLNLLDLNRDELEALIEDEASRVVAAEYRSLLTTRHKLRDDQFRLGSVLTVRKVNNQPEVNVRLQGGPRQRIKNFCKLLDSWPNRFESYAVPPRASVERISDSAGFRSEQESAISAALSAGTVGINSAISYLDALESQRQGIRRQPVVVGYARTKHHGATDETGHAAMGWILGPRFQPRYKAAGFDYRHRPTQVPLSAVVSVPAWWPSMRLTVTTCWASSHIDFGSDLPPCAETEERTFDVQLPGDAAEILRELIPRARRPQPFFYEPGPNLEIGRKEQVVVYGRDLWRNPRIFLGNQPADDLEILPDMEGLLATFNNVRRPAGWTKNQPNGPVDVWVWTSEGRENAGQAWVHKPHQKPKKGDPKLDVAVEPTSPFVSANSARKGVVGLRFKFAQKPTEADPTKKEDIVERVFLSFEGAVPDFTGIEPHSDTTTSPEPCLVQNDGVLQVNRSCQPQIPLQNLVLNTTVTITVYRTKDNKPGSDPAASLPLTVAVR